MKPIMLVDIDGVCNPLSAAPRVRPEWTWRVERSGRNRGWVAPELGTLLRSLTAVADVMWCSGWEEDAVGYARHLQVPTWPWLPLTEPQGSAGHLKIPSIDAHLNDRAICWFDDENASAATEWARTRDQRVATLFVEVDPRVGLTESEVWRAYGWAKDVQLVHGANGCRFDGMSSRV